ncbi:MAG: hypothetical protein KIT31_03375 [Deltaproteobacteria bacterium]|nr:hypothetical protein [Deltaproteobacteria bacterium]
MSQRADRELDRLLHIARPEVSPDFADGVLSRIGAADEPMPIAPAIVLPFRARRFSPLGRAAVSPSLFLRTAIVTAPLVAMLALVFVIATTLFSDKGAERRGPSDSSAVLSPAGPSVEELQSRIEENLQEQRRLRAEIERQQTELNAREPHAFDGRRRCSTCHEVSKLVSFAIPALAQPSTIERGEEDASRAQGKPRLGVVAYVDLAAPDAPEMMQAIETMVLKFSSQVSIEIRNPSASPAARAAMAAAQRGAYWQMVECLGDPVEQLDDPMRTCASDAHVEAADLASPAITAALDADAAQARAAGVTGPAIIVGDRVFAGPRAHVDARDFVNVALARRTASL